MQIGKKNPTRFFIFFFSFLFFLSSFSHFLLPQERKTHAYRALKEKKRRKFWYQTYITKAPQSEQPNGASQRASERTDRPRNRATDKRILLYYSLRFLVVTDYGYY